MAPLIVSCLISRNDLMQVLSAIFKEEPTAANAVSSVLGLKVVEQVLSSPFAFAKSALNTERIIKKYAKLFIFLVYQKNTVSIVRNT